MSRKWNYNMKEAPKDGTVIEVMDSPNGEHVNIMYARWHTHYGGNELNPPPDNIMTSWWGLSFRTGFDTWKTQEPGRLFGRASDVAISPFAWRPCPKPPKNAIKKYREIMEDDEEFSEEDLDSL
jgi:hypothetical protein